MGIDTIAQRKRSADQTQQAAARTPTVVIQPTRGWRSLALHEVWEYRELLWFLTWRDIKGRYRQMALGPLWIVIRPLVDMVIFSVIFGAVARLPSEGIPYPIFTYTAILPWTYFSRAADTSVGSLVSRMSVISKVYFPRLVVPISAVLAALVDLGISFLILLGMMAFYGFGLSWAMLALPLYVLLATATAAVRFRDLQTAISYGLRVWMYATPVAYSASLIPQRWQLLYQLNPMYWVVEGFRWALLSRGQVPQAADAGTGGPGPAAAHLRCLRLPTHRAYDCGSVVIRG